MPTSLWAFASELRGPIALAIEQLGAAERAEVRAELESRAARTTGRRLRARGREPERRGALTGARLAYHPTTPGALAEWLGSGLQSRLQRFESARRLLLTRLRLLSTSRPSHARLGAGLHDGGVRLCEETEHRRRGPRGGRRPSAGRDAERLQTCQGQGGVVLDLPELQPEDVRPRADGPCRPRLPGGPNEVDNVVRILASPAMVRIDEQRSFIPALGTCLAGSMRAHAPKAMTVLTSQAYAFPNVARVTLAYRVPWEVRSGGQGLQRHHRPDRLRPRTWRGGTGRLRGSRRSWHGAGRADAKAGRDARADDGCLRRQTPPDRLEAPAHAVRQASVSGAVAARASSLAELTAQPAISKLGTWQVRALSHRSSPRRSRRCSRPGSPPLRRRAT